MSKNIKTIPTSEYEAVVHVVEKFYVEAGRMGDNSLLEKAFHKDATMYGYSADGELSAGSWSNLKDYINQYGTAPNIRTRSDIVAITPTTAVVKLDMESAADGSSFTDFHTLVKFDGEWKIISKVFHTYET